jgi:hypothetical protein
VVPIEILYISLLFIFGIVGATRGISKELGVTLPLLVALYFLVKFGGLMIYFIDSVLKLFGFGGIIGSPDAGLFTWFLYTLIILFTVLISYMGVTLDYPGVEAKAPFSGVVNMMAGMMNGYLAVGTIWYYLDEFNYPIVKFGWYQPPLSSLAQIFVNFLPLNVLPSGTAEWYLLGAILFLVVLRVIR